MSRFREERGPSVVGRRPLAVGYCVSGGEFRTPGGVLRPLGQAFTPLTRDFHSLIRPSCPLFGHF